MKYWWWSGLIALSGCGVLGPAGQGDLNAARRTWEASGLRNYDFTFRWECFCAYTQPVRIFVHDGTIGYVTETATGDPVPDAAEKFNTVDGLFDIIQDAIDRNAHSITVTYDPDRGFPVTVRIDYEEFAVDEEMGFTISSLFSFQGAE